MRVYSILISALVLLSSSLIVNYFFGSYVGEFTKSQRIKYGEWAVIAGGSEGLGAEWARQLASQSLNVLIIARRKEALEQVALSIRTTYPNVEVETLVTDLLDLSPSVVLHDIQKNGSRKIGLVVYNAMYQGMGHFTDVPIETLKKVVNVNNVALLELVHPLTISMKTNDLGGGVVLMSSLAGETGIQNFGTYAASKSFITVLARSLSLELKPYNIDVLSCIAGATLTPGYVYSRLGVNKEKSLIVWGKRFLSVFGF